MMQQLSIDQAIEEARRPKTEDIFSAVARCADNANKGWREKALTIVKELCRTNREITTDMVWRELGKTGWKTHDPRALGSILLAANSLGLCKKTGRYVPSERPACHRRPIPVWESLWFAASS